MQEKVEILIEGRNPINVELLSEFEINDNGSKKRFILLTNNDIDQNGLIKILASEIDGGQIKKIESDEDWTKVKNIMRSIIASAPENVTYINTSEHKSFNAQENYARVIAVQDSAKQAIIKDYQEKKPEVEVKEDVTPVDVEDPNAAIYPTDNTIAPIGSEIANGISETPIPVVNDIVDNAEPIEDDDEPIEEPVVEETVSDFPEIQTPIQEVQSVQPISNPTVNLSLDSLKEELINEITLAVDKYIDNIKLSIENQELKSIIDKLQNK